MAGLLPEVFWGLTWNDYDRLLFHHRYRAQQELAGHRQVATQIYNALQGFAKQPKSIAPATYWPLPLIDPEPAPPAVIDWEKHRQLAERSGKRFAPLTD